MSNNGLIMEFVSYFKERKNYWLLPTILLLSLVLLSSGVLALQSDFSYCKNLTVEGGSSLINDFISYVNVSYSPNMQTNFEDIRIYDQACGNAGSELSYEFDSVINSNSAGIWLKSNLNTGNNIYSIYYGNSTIGNGENPFDVWNDYDYVYHFSEGIGNFTKDSASGNSLFAYNVSTDSSESFNWIDSQAYGKAVRFNPYDDNVGSSGCAISIYNVTDMLGNSNRSVFVYEQKIDQATHGHGIVEAIGYPNPNNYFNFRIRNSDGAYILDGNSYGWNTGKVDDGNFNFHYIELFNDVANWTFNGDENLGTTSHVFDTTSAPITVGGAFIVGGGYLGCIAQFNGTVDELRISNKTFSAEYVSRNYQNVNVSMFSFGAEESLSPDLIYPDFSDYYDNSGELIDSGTAIFNVTVYNTNYTVVLVLNGSSYIPSNDYGDVYSASVSLTNAGTYDYYWYAYGSGTNNNYNSSANFTYVVNQSVVIPNPTPTNNYDVIGASGYGISVFFGSLTSSLSGLLLIIAIVGAIVLVLGGVVFLVMYAINYAKTR